MNDANPHHLTPHPDCMMPDGAEPCQGFTVMLDAACAQVMRNADLVRENARLKADLAKVIPGAAQAARSFELIGAISDLEAILAWRGPNGQGHKVVLIDRSKAELIAAALAAQPPAAQVETPQDQFCQWLKGYLGAFPGRDEIDAFDANVIRNTLNETLAGNYISPRASRSSAETSGQEG